MRFFFVLITSFALQVAYAQDKSLVNTSQSKHAVLSSINMGDVQWTNGFWAERFAICKDSMVPRLWQTYNDAKLCHSFENFRVAARLDTGSFVGPSFHDGDFYKTLEAVAALYASTKDPQLDAMMDNAIAVIAKAQRADGYVYTKALIDQQKTGKAKVFDDRLSFEAYNFGHLMTAACVHYRATGKTTLLAIAQKAAGFLVQFYNKATPEQARNAICPSHYMGLVELYRVTHQQQYLTLAEKLINIRGVAEGTDDNSDRVPFREMKQVMGHAVRANYLFAGAADVYAETGDTSLLRTLNMAWDEVVNHKMYITGGCGALYDGVSNDGTSYNPDTVQKIHQAYGRDYQLPNTTAHNETCANIGNLLWNWRMLEVTADARYMDILEQTLYNSILSGISLDGTKFFYTNPLRASDAFPYSLRWTGGRSPYISLSNCCPPNVVRTIAEVSDYAYSTSAKGLYVNLYGSNNLHTILPNGSALQVTQQSGYPWDGKIALTIQSLPAANFAVYLRIPGWCSHATVLLNGQPYAAVITPGTYAAIQHNWQAGDRIELQLDMPVQLIESNPLVEETRNQVAVKRGPVVYCVESVDLPAGEKISNLLVPVQTRFTTTTIQVDNSTITALRATVQRTQATWNNTLYQPVNTTNNMAPVTIQLIPYYAWANRGHSEMSVWLPVIK